MLLAAQRPLLPVDNVHVNADLAKVKKGQPLSPILAVRGDLVTGCALQMADGYHRVCASYCTDENTHTAVVLVARSGKRTGQPGRGRVGTVIGATLEWSCS